MKVVPVIVRLALGAMLFYAGFSKLGALSTFADAIANYRVLPAQMTTAIAVVLPWWEITIGILLVLGLWQRAAALLALLLFTIFALAAGSAVLRGLDIRCGCFGGDAKVGLVSVAIDLAGIAASWLSLRTEKSG